MLRQDKKLIWSIKSGFLLEGGMNQSLKTRSWASFWTPVTIGWRAPVVSVVPHSYPCEIRILFKTSSCLGHYGSRMCTGLEHSLTPQSRVRSSPLGWASLRLPAPGSRQDADRTRSTTGWTDSWHWDCRSQSSWPGPCSVHRPAVTSRSTCWLRYSSLWAKAAEIGPYWCLHPKLSCTEFSLADRSKNSVNNLRAQINRAQEPSYVHV